MSEKEQVRLNDEELSRVSGGTNAETKAIARALVDCGLMPAMDYTKAQNSPAALAKLVNAILESKLDITGKLSASAADEFTWSGGSVSYSQLMNTLNSLKH